MYVCMCVERQKERDIEESQTDRQTERLTPVSETLHYNFEITSITNID